MRDVSDKAWYGVCMCVIDGGEKGRDGEGWRMQERSNGKLSLRG